jgi:ribosomal protein S18 acetylase RimI-like enzyme
MAEQPLVVPYHADYEADVLAMWQAAFPDDPAKRGRAAVEGVRSIRHKDLFYVCFLGDLLVGSALAGYDGVRAWVYEVAVHPGYRGRGIASALMNAVETGLARKGCTKLNLQVKVANRDAMRFYERSGYAVEARVSMSKQLD